MSNINAVSLHKMTNTKIDGTRYSVCTSTLHWNR